MKRRNMFARVHTWFVTSWKGHLNTTDCEVSAREMCVAYAGYYKTPFDAIYGAFGVCPVIYKRSSFPFVGDRCGFYGFIPPSMRLECPDEVFAIWGDKASYMCQETLFLGNGAKRNYFLI